MRASDGWLLGCAFTWIAFAVLVLMAVGIVGPSTDRYIAALAWEGLAALAFLSRITPRKSHD
jgi:hypothetical protein